jgi:hypothetical protein
MVKNILEKNLDKVDGESSLNIPNHHQIRGPESYQ